MIETRLAGVEDEPFLYLVYASTRVEEISTWGWDETQVAQFLDMQWRMQKNSYKLQFPNAEQVVVLYEGTPAGRLLLNRAQNKISLIDISLLPSFRSHGIGEWLIRRLQQEATTESQMIELHVASHNRARRLYERLGFELADTSDMYWSMCWYPYQTQQ